jgi:hypothetical protein
MGKPTKEEMEQALGAAAAMREQGDDPDHIAKALLNLNYRMKYMERVLYYAEHFLRGMGPHEHTRLQEAIREAREAERHSTGADSESFGLE